MEKGKGKMSYEAIRKEVEESENTQHEDFFEYDSEEEEERNFKETRKALRHNEMASYVADAQFGIPTRCPCGGWMKEEVCKTPKSKHDFDTCPGQRYWTCPKFKDNGLHFRQPWVFGVEGEVRHIGNTVQVLKKQIEDMTKQLESQAEEIAQLKVGQQFP